MFEILSNRMCWNRQNTKTFNHIEMSVERLITYRMEVLIL